MASCFQGVISGAKRPKVPSTRGMEKDASGSRLSTIPLSSNKICRNSMVDDEQSLCINRRVVSLEMFGLDLDATGPASITSRVSMSLFLQERGRQCRYIHTGTGNSRLSTVFFRQNSAE
jgi:hypothetical protein